MRPSRIFCTPSCNAVDDRLWLPCCTMRSYLRAAATICFASKMLGVAMEIASMDLSSRILRISWKPCGAFFPLDSTRFTKLAMCDWSTSEMATNSTLGRVVHSWRWLPPRPPHPTIAMRTVSLALACTRFPAVIAAAAPIRKYLRSIGYPPLSYRAHRQRQLPNVVVGLFSGLLGVAQRVTFEHHALQFARRHRQKRARARKSPARPHCGARAAVQPYHRTSRNRRARGHLVQLQLLGIPNQEPRPEFRVHL